MEAGQLRHKITIQQPIKNSWEEITQWLDVASVWARIEPLRGQEYLELRHANAEETGRITIRYRPDVTPAMRIAWGSRIYNILAILDPDEQHKLLQIMVKEQIG
jgi:SPP1 family predicted phage head-tail adaptor